MTKVSSPSLTLRRQAFELERAHLRRSFFENLEARPALEALSRQVDELVRSTCELHLASLPVSVFAIGGFGRRELFPHSDVDLFFVYREVQQPAIEKGITAIVQDLWDLGVELSQQVRNISELESLDLGQTELLLAVLDARFLFGQAKLSQEVLKLILPRIYDRCGDDLAAQVIELTRHRHTTFQNTIYQLEPDLKLAPGGLRDHLAALWLEQLKGGLELKPHVRQGVDPAFEFISRLRIALHFLCDRKQNRLSHRLQGSLAENLGHEQDSRSAVESLMKQYFQHARVLHLFCQRAMEAARGEIPGEKLEGSAPQLSTPEGVLGLFQQALREGKQLSESTRESLVQVLPETFREISHVLLQEQVRDIFTPRPGLYRVLSEMFELGVLEVLFPEFAGIRSRVIRDFYHRYTVDEHTLLAIRNVEDLGEADQPSERRFRSLLEEIENPELLTLALLLHDVGKYREGKHVDTGARLAAKALRRFRFSRSAIDLVVFLIRQHLAMSSVIFRRDLDDEEVIRRFAELVGDTDRLRLLCLLTFADIKAVGPGTLTDWKRDLLWQLYVLTYNCLTRGYGSERISEADIQEDLIAALPEGLDSSRFESFLRGFPKRYLQSTGPAEVFRHFELAGKLSRQDPVQIRLSRRKTHYELLVVTPDQYRLFARIAGLLSYFEMNILKGYGFSNQQNTVLDFFQFDDTRGVFRSNPAEMERFKKLLAGAVGGQVSVDRLLEGKESSPLFRSELPGFAPTVFFDDNSAGAYTIMEIVAPDSLGLLYRIGKEISHHNCNLDLLLISTEGNKAVDVFYLSFKKGKLSQPLQKKLRSSILKALGSEDETSHGNRPTKQG